MVVTLFSYIGITHTGAVIGGSVGGLLALVLILVAGILFAAILWYFVHRRKTVAGMCLHAFVASAAVVDPYTHVFILVQIPSPQHPRDPKHPMQGKHCSMQCLGLV